MMKDRKINRYFRSTTWKLSCCWYMSVYSSRVNYYSTIDGCFVNKHTCLTGPFRISTLNSYLPIRAFKNKHFKAELSLEFCSISFKVIRTIKRRSNLLSMFCFFSTTKKKEKKAREPLQYSCVGLSEKCVCVGLTK